MTTSVADIAESTLEALDRGEQIGPFSEGDATFDLDQAYAIIARMRELREARGERVVGRKIGFTNRRIWSEYGVFAPIWGYVYDTTAHELSNVGGGFSLDAFSEPQIEPEIAFKLRTVPRGGLSPEELLGSIEWATHGFEIVQSIFPGWKFTAADSVAANGLHGALLLGPQRQQPQDLAEWTRMLCSFDIELSRNGEKMDRGHASNVIDGPLHALLHLIELLRHDQHNPPLAAGEIITTGTLTRAFPAVRGQRWDTALHGIPLDGISVMFSNDA
ncbi:MAG TPA: fumarylacetoacetate hydrolase family protein [Candidatus Baltobacteraceae bacterium]|jgi:2-oxo-3-hexenedioate decarboxylase